MSPTAPLLPTSTATCPKDQRPSRWTVRARSAVAGFLRPARDRDHRDIRVRVDRADRQPVVADCADCPEAMTTWRKRRSFNRGICKQTKGNLHERNHGVHD